MIRAPVQAPTLIRAPPRTLLRASDVRAAEAESRQPRRLAFLLLLAVLPLFGQTFYYFSEFPVPYYLSKVWSALVLPFSIYALVALDLPYKALFTALLAYVLTLSPLIGMLHLGNGLVDSVTTTVKVWPFTNYFALAAVLMWLRPTPRMLARAVLLLGAVTFLVMWPIWVLAPADWYGIDQSSKLLMFEQERGYRIYMPMFFGMLFLFYLARRFGQRWEWWTGLLLVGAFVTLALIYKQRTSIIAALIVATVYVLSSTRGAWRSFVLAVSLAAAAAGIFVLSGAEMDRMADSLGNSLAIRLRTIGHAVDFLGSNPLSWLFGVGATTRFSTVTLAQIFGDAHFFLADIGWLGIVFEYGIVGALLVTAVYVAGLAFLWKAARSRQDPFLGALADYLAFLLLASTVYSMVFTTGEVATVMAIGAYLARFDRPSSERAAPTMPAPVIGGDRPMQRGLERLRTRRGRPAPGPPSRP
jgi:hypothetical protein